MCVHIVPAERVHNVDDDFFKTDLRDASCKHI
jgi:hypothetical protein